METGLRLIFKTINPETIPQTGYMDLTVFFTEPCEITVAHPATMNVYGDVKLTMRQGKAHVYTTKFVSEAYGDSFMYMHNQTRAVAHDRATVTLREFDISTSLLNMSMSQPEHVLQHKEARKYR